MQRLFILWRSFAYALAVVLTLGASGIAQTKDASSALAGTWEGTLGSGSGALRLVLEVSRAADGLNLGVLQSLDQGGVKIPIDRIDVKDNHVTLTVGAVGGAFEGTISGSPPVLTGTWTQLGRSLPLQLTRRAEASRSAAAADASAATTTSAALAAERNYPLGLPLELHVPTAPVPFAGSSGRYLAYELHITNFAPGSLLLSRVEVLSGANVLTASEGAELNALLVAPSMPKAVDNRNLGAGMRAIAFLWIALQAGANTPATIEHRVTVGTTSVQGGRVAVSQLAAPIVAAPLTGGDWFAANGPSNTSIHRRALMVAHGGAHIAQRFAIDWVRLGANGRTFSGDQAKNASYYAYGAEAVAVADARVAVTHDGIPENVPGITSRAVPITAETIAGHFVVLELAGGLFAIYAHFQPGTLRVKEGDRVTRGQVLGLVGNSGNSTEPHLHFHMADGNAPWFAAEGVPYAIDSYEAGTAAGRWELRQKVLPLENERVRFAGRR
jgi:peptidase M23-like protein